MTERAQMVISYLKQNGYSKVVGTAQDCGLSESELTAVIEEIEAETRYTIFKGIRCRVEAKTVWLKLCNT